MNYYKPEDIVQILNSIKKLSIEDGELDVLFYGFDSPESISGFERNSFTRNLLELIESTLKEQK